MLQQGIPDDAVLNVNVPLAPLCGVRVSRLGRRIYTEGVIERLDPSGRQYFWIGGSSPRWTPDERSDHDAVSGGCISATPLHLDMTHDHLMETLVSWNLPLPMPGEDTPARERR